MEYVRVAETLNHPIGAVWGMVAAFGALKAWVAGVDSCALEGEGIGAVRSVRLGDHVTRERLDSIDAAAHRISYSLLEPHVLPAENVRATIELRALDDARTEIVWFSEATKIASSQAELAGFIDAFYRASIERLNALLSA